MPARKKPAKRATPAVRRYKMEGLEQVRALSHPLRLKLVELFAMRPMTTKQAADALHEAPTRLYHHVAALESAGLIRLRETRPNRGTTEKYFEAVAHRYEATSAAVGIGRKDGSGDHAALGMILFEQARNELVRALGTRSAAEAVPMVAMRAVMRMSPRTAKRVAKELTAMIAKFRTSESQALDAEPPAGRPRYSLTIAFLPIDDVDRAP